MERNQVHSLLLHNAEDSEVDKWLSELEHNPGAESEVVLDVGGRV